MLKFKHISLVLFAMAILTSCSEFSRVLNKGNSLEQYNLAEKLYNNGKYTKALQLFEKLLPDFQGKPQMERIQYMMSDSYFKTKDYMLAAYHFERFTKNYPRSSKKEEALFLAAYCNYLSTDPSGLDQTDTTKAIESFQNYISKYPESEKVAEANKYVKELQTKLEKKEFDIAYQYYHTEQYKAAIVAFDNFLSDNLGTSYKEDALYYKARASFDLALNSVDDKKQTRLNEALQAVERVQRNFKNTPYQDELDKMKNRIQQELEKNNTTTNAQ